MHKGFIFCTGVIGLMNQTLLKMIEILAKNIFHCERQSDRLFYLHESIMVAQRSIPTSYLKVR